MNRRTLLGGAVALPALAVAAVPAAAAAPVIDARWDRLVAAYERADADLTTADAAVEAVWQVHEPKRTALGDCPQAPPNVYPRPVLDMTVREMRDCRPCPDAQARYEADFAAWRDKVDALMSEGLDAAQEHYDAVVDVQDRAAHALFAYPAPTTAALLYKLAVAEQAYRNCDLRQSVAAQLMADVRRLLGGEQAA